MTTQRRVAQVVVAAVCALGFWFLPELRRAFIRDVVSTDAEPGPPPTLVPAPGAAPIAPASHVRVVLVDGAGRGTSRMMPAWDDLCTRGLDLVVDVGFPTVSLPVQIALWSGLTQQQTGILFHAGKPLAHPLATSIPAQVPGSIAVAESHPEIIGSVGFALAEPPLGTLPVGWDTRVDRSRAHRDPEPDPARVRPHPRRRRRGSQEGPRVERVAHRRGRRRRRARAAARGRPGRPSRRAVGRARGSPSPPGRRPRRRGALAAPGPRVRGRARDHARARRTDPPRRRVACARRRARGPARTRRGRSPAHRRARPPARARRRGARAAARPRRARVPDHDRRRRDHRVGHAGQALARTVVASGRGAPARPDPRRADAVDADVLQAAGPRHVPRVHARAAPARRWARARAAARIAGPGARGPARAAGRDARGAADRDRRVADRVRRGRRPDRPALDRVGQRGSAHGGAGTWGGRDCSSRHSRPAFVRSRWSSGNCA